MTSHIEQWMRENPNTKITIHAQLKLLPAHTAPNWCRHCGAVEDWLHLGFHQEGTDGVTAGTVTGIDKDGLPVVTPAPIDLSKPVLLCSGCGTIVIVQRCGA